ncbi:MAG: ARMT1-like domain-containing protein [Solidesulfovibrio sp.]|uniref:ARMT1-like domain-containing protein n=1 Tax=Solidesulfovibrio sp. TaxID=2910990 RepID=UPI002B21424B|nr:ARMT1-like domain-containing protein [Solidesulfovibrio sp.]MEA4857725.1 ARMT1-like domain-containing protein [Solidesulfovibrio sp.]
MTDRSPRLAPPVGQAPRYGTDPVRDAWLLHFMTENNLEHSIAPEKNASPEQLRFMVSLAPEEIYVPCSDAMFSHLISERADPLVVAEYDGRLARIGRLIDDYVSDPYTAVKIRTLCDLKYRQALVKPTLIPSRLAKRLCTIFLTQSGLDDPHRERKRLYNRRAFSFIQGETFRTMLYACPSELPGCRAIPELRFALDMLELKRLLLLGSMPGIWDGRSAVPGNDALERALAAFPADFSRLEEMLDPRRGQGGLKILYLPDAAGGILFDLLAVRALLRLGHRVIVAVKDGFYYDAPTIWDADTDPILDTALAGAHFLTDPRVTKNALLQVMRESPLTVISDGTRERLNLYRVSVTFSRAWKEADLVMARGPLNHRRLIETSHLFTRDVVSFHGDGAGGLRFDFKPRAPGARSFSEADITAKADEIIAGMRAAKAAGRSVMFYSAIIGSIPGQTRTAIELVTAFVANLRDKLPGTSIINPAEHFEEGMDADDLMFMWEKVQRSGLIDVWRFQTHFDIEKSFGLLGRAVPPVWAGKDATFSTGCTKEMRIALSMQSRQPELQIIGPDPEKFLRRREYGVGKFCDAGIDCR